MAWRFGADRLRSPSAYSPPKGHDVVLDKKAKRVTCDTGENEDGQNQKNNVQRVEVVTDGLCWHPACAGHDMATDEEHATVTRLLWPHPGLVVLELVAMEGEVAGQCSSEALTLRCLLAKEKSRSEPPF